MIGKEGDVVSPFAQGRDEQLDRVDPVKQVLAETAVAYCCVQVGVGRTDQPYIYLCLLGRSEAVYLLLFDHREQLRLEHKRQVPDLIQKERAAGCDLETSRLAFPRIGKRPFFVSEQFAFEQVVRDTSQVDRDKCLLVARRLFVKRIGDQVFSRPVLALQQDIGIRMFQLLQCPEYLFHHRRFADHLYLQLCGGEHRFLFFQRLYFTAAQAEFEGGRDGCQHLFVLPGFRDKVGGTCFDGTDGFFRIRIGGDQDHDRRGRYFADAFQPVKTFFAADGIGGKVHIEQDHVVFGSRHQAVDLFRVGAGRNAFRQRAKQHLQSKEYVFVVVDH